MRLILIAAALSLASAAHAKPAPAKPFGTAAAGPDVVKACMVDALLDEVGYATATPHHQGWRVDLLQPQLGTYWADIQPEGTGSTVAVYGTFANVLSGVLPHIRPCLTRKE